MLKHCSISSIIEINASRCEVGLSRLSSFQDHAKLVLQKGGICLTWIETSHSGTLLFVWVHATIFWWFHICVPCQDWYFLSFLKLLFEICSLTDMLFEFLLPEFLVIVEKCWRACNCIHWFLIFFSVFTIFMTFSTFCEINHSITFGNS